MRKAILFLPLFFLGIAHKAFSQKIISASASSKDIVLGQLTAKQQAAVNAIAKKHRQGAVSLQMIKKEIRGRSDLSSMSVEDATDIILMQVSQDAEDDLKNAEASIQSANEKKDSLRKKAEELKREQDARNRKLKNEYDTLRSVYSNQGDAKYKLYMGQIKTTEVESADAARKKKNAEDHLQSVRDAIHKSEQTQSQ